MCTASIWHRLSVEDQGKILEYVRKLLDGQLSSHASLDELSQIPAQETQLDVCWDIGLRNSAEAGTYAAKDKVSDDIPCGFAKCIASKAAPASQGTRLGSVTAFKTAASTNATRRMQTYL